MTGLAWLGYVTLYELTIKKTFCPFPAFQTAFLLFPIVRVRGMPRSRPAAASLQKYVSSQSSFGLWINKDNILEEEGNGTDVGFLFHIIINPANNLIFPNMNRRNCFSVGGTVKLD